MDSKRNPASSDSSFSGWSSSSSSDDDNNVVPPPVANAGISSSISDETKTLSDDDDKAEDDDDVGALLDSLPRERLISLLLTSASRSAKVRREIRRISQDDPGNNCKIAVRNLPWRTTSHDLRTLFSQYGAIKDCHVATDGSSGRSKGFGFVHFLNPNSAIQALQSPHKQIGGRVATCVPVTPWRHCRTDHIKNNPRKIYVARVWPGVDRTRLHGFFSRYGEIEEGPIGFNRFTGAMFVYRTEEGARRALEEPMKNFDGCLLQCQPAGDVGKVIGSSNSGFRSERRGCGYGADDNVEAPPPGYKDPWCSW